MQSWKSRPSCHVLVGAAMLALTSATVPAVAQTYPSQKITFIVGFSAGGVADGIGRLIGQKVSERLGQTVVVENRGGAGGNIAAKVVSGANADGYTVLVTTSALAINETLYKNKTFAAADFATAAIVASSPESLSALPTVPAKNIGEYLKAMQGKPINFGTAGAGSGSHIAAAYFFKEHAKAQATHIPFQGGAPATNAAIAGHIDLLALTIGGGVVAQIKGGKLKGLAVASDKRLAAAPDVPTYAEAGFPGFTASSWVGFFVPAKTPADVIAKLNGAIDATVKDPEVQNRLAALGFDPVTGSQSQAQNLFKSEVDKWGKMVTTLGLSIN
ncbi:MAG: Bug family tripartite tricarboxylate transporter substrate binding protein [Pseudolabrys sp.]